MINLIKKKLGITAIEGEIRWIKVKTESTKCCLEAHAKFVTDKMAELKEYTRVDADVGYRGNNTIILTGVYRKRAYVQFFDLGDGEFTRLIEQLKDMRKHCLIRHIDAPYEFRGDFDL